MTDKTVRTQITADAAQANREWRGFADNVQRASGSVQASMNSLRNIAGNALAAVASFNAARGLVGVADQATLAEARIRQVTTATQAARDANASLYTMAQRLGAPFAEAQAMFSRMAPAVTELKGGARESVALSEILITTGRLAGASAAEAAAGATQFAQAMASGVLQGDELKSLLENNPVLARELAAALGTNVGALREMGAQGKLTADVVGNALLGRFDEIKAAGQGLPLTVGGAFQQIQNAASEAFNAWAKGTGVIEFIAKLFSEVASIIEVLRLQMRSASGESTNLGAATTAAAQTMGKGIAYVVDLVRALVGGLAGAGTLLGGLAAAAVQAADGQFRMAAQTAGDAWGKTTSAIGKAIDAVMAKGETLQAYNQRLGGGGSATEPAGDRNPFARLQAAAGNATKPSAVNPGAQTRMGQWEADLADWRLALARQAAMEGQHREMTRAEEAKYWAELAARRDLNDKERVALARKTAEAELGALRDAHDAKVQVLQAEAAEFRANIEERMRIELQIQGMYAQGSKGYEDAARRIADLRRQAARQAAAVADEEAAAAQQRQLAEIAVAEQSMRTLQQLGLADQQQVLAAQAAFEQRRNQLALESLQQRLQAAQADPDRNPVELARLHAQIEELQQRHSLRMGQIQQAATVDAQKNTVDTLQNIQSGWAQLLQQLAQGTLTIGGFVKGVFQAVAQAVVQTMAKMVAEWVVKQVAMMIFGKTTAAATITAEAAKAGAGGVASMAAAPFPFNLGAPLFGKAMAAAALAFQPMVAAAGGFDIPAGVNPVVQAHQREMILPATLSDTVRDMAQVYSETRNAGGAAAEPLAMRVVPMPGDFWLANRNDLLRAVQRAQKDRL